MIVTEHEYEIIELLKDTFNGAIKECDLIRCIGHGRHYTRTLLMSLKCKYIISVRQIKVENSNPKWVLLEDEYK